jgi:hypothetical protein
MRASRPTRRTLLAAAACIAPFAVAGQADAARISSPGPLTEISINETLENCNALYAGDVRPIFYSGLDSGACATRVAVDGVAAALAASSQTPTSGSGTSADPYSVTTVNAVSGHPELEVTQVDRYVVGNEFWRTDVTLSNSGAEPAAMRLYRSADCYLGDSDAGYGAVDVAAGAVFCSKNPNNVPAGRIEGFIPLSPGSSYGQGAYAQAAYYTPWSGRPYGNTCECDVLQDNGAGLSWDVEVPAGGSATRSLLNTMSPSGVVAPDPDPEPVNAVPEVGTAAADATGVEGETLTASGSFTDADAADTLTITPSSEVGEFIVDGRSWSWSLATTDDVAVETLTVTADDGEGGSVSDAFDFSAANAAPVLSALATTGAGASGCTPTLGFSFSDAGSGDTHTGTVAWGDGSTTSFGASKDVSLQHPYAEQGTYDIAVTLADDDEGTDSDGITGHRVHNVASGFLEPLNADGSSRFKRGSTIPLKVVIKDCHGDLEGALGPQVSLRQLNDSGTTSTAVNEVVSNATPDVGRTMRWADTQYLFNLSSKRSQFAAGQDLTAGKYEVKVTEGTLPAPVVQQFRLVR